MRNLSTLFLGALLALGLFWLVAFLTGYSINVRPKLGSPSVEVLDFAPAGPTEPFENVTGGGPPRNVIMLIGDGMGMSHVIAARALTVGVEGRLTMERLPVTGRLTTHAFESIYTDSAAGATALATGHKTVPGMLSITGERRRLSSFAHAARARGMRLGLLTDSYLLDATPAAFLSYAYRGDFEAVAHHLARGGATFLAGGLPENLEADEEAAIAEVFRAEGFTIAESVEQLRAAPDPVVGLFPWESIADARRPPELIELVDAALERLDDAPRGFFLLIETEETDTGSHFNDFERVIAGIRVLDAAVARALAFAREDGETLIIVTADHETGGLMLLGGGPGEPLRYRWGSYNHTTEPVPLFAYGPGAERFAGLNDNTEVARILSTLLGLDELPQEGSDEVARGPE